jgi:uncharacterized membrane protein YkvA (DUF1232 family)
MAKVPAKSARSAQPARGQPKPRTAGAAEPPAKTTSEPLITHADLRRVVDELASTLAPADVGDLLAEEEKLRSRAATLGGKPGEIFRVQLDLALECLHDHAAGRCPQIPYYTISLLTAAMAYLADDLDIIPDFLPKRGIIDDALVLAMACSLGDSGLRRYCAWKGIDGAPALGLVVQRPRPSR